MTIVDLKHIMICIAQPSKSSRNRNAMPIEADKTAIATTKRQAGSQFQGRKLSRLGNYRRTLSLLTPHQRG
eukprot:COSAG06_NODE_106_length_23773_cov_20.279083_24_plen_71_part_00